MDLALNNLQRLICHKTKQNQTKPLTISLIKPHALYIRRLNSLKISPKRLTVLNIFQFVGENSLSLTILSCNDVLISRNSFRFVKEYTVL